MKTFEKLFIIWFVFSFGVGPVIGLGFQVNAYPWLGIWMSCMFLNITIGIAYILFKKPSL